MSFCLSTMNNQERYHREKERYPMEQQIIRIICDTSNLATAAMFLAHQKGTSLEAEENLHPHGTVSAVKSCFQPGEVILMELNIILDPTSKIVSIQGGQDLKLPYI